MFPFSRSPARDYNSLDYRLRELYFQETPTRLRQRRLSVLFDYKVLHDFIRLTFPRGVFEIRRILLRPSIVMLESARTIRLYKGTYKMAQGFFQIVTGFPRRNPNGLCQRRILSVLIYIFYSHNFFFFPSLFMIPLYRL